MKKTNQDLTNQELSLKDLYNRLEKDEDKNKNNKVKFADVIGYDKEKAELLEIKNYFDSPEKYEEIGARVPKGIILVGPAGTGKTMLVKAIINEINVNAIVYDQEKHRTVKQLFEEAREKQPCLIFIDELDKLVTTRAYTRTETTFSRDLMVQLDGYDTNEKIIVITTSNDTYDIPKTLLRSGRIDRTIIFKNPNKDEKVLLLEHYFKKIKTAPDVNLTVVAEMITNFSCADICNLANEANLLTYRNNQEEVTMHEINLAIDRILFSSTDSDMTLELRKQVAIHEIGHALVAIQKGYYDKLIKISIVNRGDTLGINQFNMEDDSPSFLTKNQLTDRICILLGGFVAEEIMCASVSAGSQNDLIEARYITFEMIRFGMMGITNVARLISNENLPDKKFQEIQDISDGMMSSNYNEVQTFLKKNIALINEMTEELLEKNTLYRKDIFEIITKHGLIKKQRN